MKWSKSTTLTSTIRNPLLDTSIVRVFLLPVYLLGLSVRNLLLKNDGIKLNGLFKWGRFLFWKKIGQGLHRSS